MSGFALVDVVAGYGAEPILHGVDLDIPEGGSLAVVGPNGSGKSTLMRVAVGLLRPRSGKVLLRDEDITRLDAPARARRGMGYVPQEANVFRNMTVLENLKLGLEFIDRHAARRFSSRRDEVLDLFPEIAPKQDTLAGHLSGGQRQMVAMAAALMPGPSFLALDEPSAGLSPKNAEALFAVIARVAQTGITLLMIEQNTRLGLGAVREGMVLAAGETRARGPAADMLADGMLQRLYLGAG